MPESIRYGVPSAILLFGFNIIAVARWYRRAHAIKATGLPIVTLDPLEAKNSGRRIVVRGCIVMPLVATISMLFIYLQFVIFGDMGDAIGMSVVGLVLTMISIANDVQAWLFRRLIVGPRGIVVDTEYITKQEAVWTYGNGVVLLNIRGGRLSIDRSEWDECRW